jgi:hypothetical protein
VTTSRPLVEGKRVGPNKTKQVVGARLQSISWKEIQYNKDGKPVSIWCWRQSQLGGPPDYIIDLTEKLWAEKFSIYLIIPTAKLTVATDRATPAPENRF